MGCGYLRTQPRRCGTAYVAYTLSLPRNHLQGRDYAGTHHRRSTSMICIDAVESRYNDSSDDDWVIGRHPTIKGVIFATSGNGHAFKVSFLLGSIILL